LTELRVIERHILPTLVKPDFMSLCLKPSEEDDDGSKKAKQSVCAYACFIKAVPASETKKLSLINLSKQGGFPLPVLVPREKQQVRGVYSYFRPPDIPPFHVSSSTERVHFPPALSVHKDSMEQLFKAVAQILRKLQWRVVDIDTLTGRRPNDPPLTAAAARKWRDALADFGCVDFVKPNLVKIVSREELTEPLSGHGGGALGPVRALLGPRELESSSFSKKATGSKTGFAPTLSASSKSLAAAAASPTPPSLPRDQPSRQAPQTPLPQLMQLPRRSKLVRSMLKLWLKRRAPRAQGASMRSDRSASTS
jgi:hypothetical protein